MLLNASLTFLNVDNPWFPVIVSCAAIVVAVVLSNRNIKKDMEKQNEAKFEKKASNTYVNHLNKITHHKINDIDTDIKALECKIDSNQKFIIERLENINNNVLGLNSKK